MSILDLSKIYFLNTIWSRRMKSNKYLFSNLHLEFRNWYKTNTVVLICVNIDLVDTEGVHCYKCIVILAFAFVHVIEWVFWWYGPFTVCSINDITILSRFKAKSNIFTSYEENIQSENSPLYLSKTFLPSNLEKK